MNIDLILMNEKMDNEFTSPVYGVKAVPVERIRANSYNPNVTAPPEMRLLELSIWEDGYTMPCVCYYIEKEDVYELVDGYHRYKVMMTSPRIYKRENGLLPVTVIRKDLIELMTRLVGELTRSGMSDSWIRRNLGMDKDELLRLKQISGLAELFADKEFRKAVE